uniref:EAL domain-containing protein n=1 Tax=Eubacterium cellulosolvens TaxID=29322 RepID=UPI000480D2A3|nr:GGDEF domain-containing phosphodiesterase [[Eubacterium] cellulosolvens]
MQQEMYKVSDVNSIKKLESVLFYDNLTGALTPYGFFQHVQDVMNRIFHEGQEPVYIFVDIVGMHHINDEYGYYAGNEVVSSVARLLGQVFPDGICSRQEADHFIVLVQNKDVKERIGEITNIYSVNKYPVPEIQMKFGLYVQQEIDEDPSVCCDKARLAEHEIHKKAGTFIGEFREEMYEIYRRKNYIIAHLEESLKDHEIEIYYHSIIRSVTEKVCSLEALARWNSKEKGTIMPSEFIPILEKEHLSAIFDLYVVEQVLKEIQIRREVGLALVPVSVNLSLSDLETLDMVTEVGNLLEKYDVDSKYLIIEIPEKACVANPVKVTSVIEGFHAKGVQVWMDDFGNGVSSLNLLKNFDFDLIKFDRGFLKGYDAGGRAEAIFRYTIMMIHNLHIHTVAEGIETRDQYLQLRLLGCDRMQGFLFTKPKPLRMFMEADDEFIRNSRELTEDMRSSGYFEKVGFARITDLELPKELGVVPEDIPEGLVEFCQGKVICLRSNRVFFDRVKAELKHIAVKQYDPGWYHLDTDENSIFRENSELYNHLEEEAGMKVEIMSWIFEPTEEHRRVLEGLDTKDQWTRYSGTNRKGQEYVGWIRLVAVDESRGAKCFEIILK